VTTHRRGCEGNHHVRDDVEEWELHGGRVCIGVRTVTLHEASLIRPDRGLPTVANVVDQGVQDRAVRNLIVRESVNDR
jgi:hypothetical protein